tara:strand:+ start:169 stop:522 length:354 start_codon:yes stop_codon:yes gene_type:complete
MEEKQKTRKRKGRKKGSTTRYCLIQDEMLGDYEIHVDESNHCFILVCKETGSTEGYYTSLPYALKRVLKEKYVPGGKNGEIYTLQEYITQMNKLGNAMAKLLIPAHWQIKPGLDKHN